jgi:hypothetical protein
VPLDRVRLTAAKSGLGRHRKLRLARPQGSGSASAPEDDELRLARPQGSDSASAPEDDELRLARPQARTQPRLRKTTNSASPDPGLGLSLGSRGRRYPPRLTRGSDSALASDDGLRLARPGAQTRPRPRRSLRLARPRARTDHVKGGAIITLPLASSGYGEQDRHPIWLAPVNK